MKTKQRKPIAGGYPLPSLSRNKEGILEAFAVFMLGRKLTEGKPRKGKTNV